MRRCGGRFAPRCPGLIRLRRVRRDLAAGVAAQLVLPFGVLNLSYGFPLNADEANPNRFLRDDVERFQVTIGLGF